MKKTYYKNMLQPSGYKIFSYLSIPVALYCFVVILPIVFALGYSFFEWSGGPKKTFIGFDNYITLFKDPVFWLSFKNTLFFTFAMVVGQVGIAFILSLFFTMNWIKMIGTHRRIMFFPNIIAPVVIGLIWQLIYNNDFGLLNTLLRGVGADSAIRLWLDDPKIVMYSVIVPVIWQYVGYYLVILMSSIGSIPREIFEVAEIDGADGLQRSLYVTIPLMWDSLKICIMICVAGSFKAFDHIMVMTGGGPGRTTSVLSLYNYNVSFVQMKLGYACSMAIIILAISLILTLGTKVLMGGKKYAN